MFTVLTLYSPVLTCLEQHITVVSNSKCWADVGNLHTSNVTTDKEVRKCFIFPLTVWIVRRFSAPAEVILVFRRQSFSSVVVHHLCSQVWSISSSSYKLSVCLKHNFFPSILPSSCYKSLEWLSLKPNMNTILIRRIPGTSVFYSYTNHVKQLLKLWTISALYKLLSKHVSVSHWHMRQISYISWMLQKLAAAKDARWL